MTGCIDRHLQKTINTDFFPPVALSQSCLLKIGGESNYMDKYLWHKDLVEIFLLKMQCRDKKGSGMSSWKLQDLIQIQNM